MEFRVVSIVDKIKLYWLDLPLKVKKTGGFHLCMIVLKNLNIFRFLLLYC